ncbi:hypothetical protein AGOR_G00087040 [Albula goreensis]|uniref:Uncharacterized protein n=1 Tax=Albula goreensis TaxID=1534307 RepID=A0A8T3DPN0_9TELE|nr:hypothetical protein AGOR_G00087040 [Albula goreensis]
MEAEKRPSSDAERDFQTVEVGEPQEGDESPQKVPRRVIHFANGETMEEYSTEDEEEQPQPRKQIYCPQWNRRT